MIMFVLGLLVGVLIGIGGALVVMVKLMPLAKLTPPKQGREMVCQSQVSYTTTLHRETHRFTPLPEHRTGAWIVAPWMYNFDEHKGGGAELHMPGHG